MNNIKTLEGHFKTNTKSAYGIIASRFNGFVVESLVQGAIDVLSRHGVSEKNITVVYVPGALEISLTAKKMAASGKYNAIIATGAVIRGSTPHFDIVANESAKGLAQVGLDSGIPVINAILTTNSIEQAIERSGTKAGNKGAEAALGAIEMVDLLSKL